MLTSRAAGVAAGDGGVHLDAVDEADGAGGRGDGAGGEGAGQGAQGRTHGVDLLAGDRRLFTEGEVGIAGEVDLQEGQVVDGAEVDHLGNVVLGAVGRLDAHLRAQVDDVVVGHNGALVVDEEAEAGRSHSR